MWYWYMFWHIGDEYLPLSGGENRGGTGIFMPFFKFSHLKF